MAGAASMISRGGFQSELLAQYAFSSWGTVVSTPNSQDHGLDLHCTFTETVGQRAWAKLPFTVQVKSNMDEWKFEGKASVRWIIEHPLPLFLCVVNKQDFRIRVYHTLPRFFVWLKNGYEIQEFKLKPTTKSKGNSIEWDTEGETISLGAPILDFDFSKLLNEDFRNQAGEVIEEWVKIENENLTRFRMGVCKFEMPHTYFPNQSPKLQHVTNYSLSNEEYSDDNFSKAKPYLREAIEFACNESLKKQDFAGAIIALILSSHLFKGQIPEKRTHIDNMLVSEETNQMLEICEGHKTAFTGIGSLQKLLYDEIERRLKSTPSP